MARQLARFAVLMRGRITRRMKQLAVILILLTASALILLWAWAVSGYARDVLINVGASVVIVALSYAIFDPVFQEIRRSRVQEQPTFDDENFSRNVANAKREVTIMDTGNHILEGDSRDIFLEALERAVQRRVVVRILLLDPDSSAAKQRAEEISPVNVRKVIMENLRYLESCRQKLSPSQRDKIQVRIYDALPAIQLFQHDFKALVSFFPVGRRASASSHLEIDIDTPLGQFVRSRFDQLWSHPSSRTIQSWMQMRLKAWNGGHPLGVHDVQYIDLQDRLYINADSIKGLLIDHGSPHLEFTNDEPSAVNLNTLLLADRVHDSSSPTLTELSTEFDMKYGPPHSSHERIVLELVPRPKQPGDG
jgi:hypothetical protein